MNTAAAALAAATLAASPAPQPADLTTAQLAGQRVIFSYQGKQPPRELVRRVQRGEAAGVMLYARNIRSRAHLKRTLAGLQRAARRSPVRLPLLLLIDQEGGLVQRLPGGPTRSAARVGSTRGAYRTGLQAGTTLRAGEHQREPRAGGRRVPAAARRWSASCAATAAGPRW